VQTDFSEKSSAARSGIASGLPAAPEYTRPFFMDHPERCLSSGDEPTFFNRSPPPVPSCMQDEPIDYLVNSTSI